jgi:hypothetical protein
MTESADMPTTPGAFDSTLSGTQDGFVAKFSPDGSKLLFGTYIGGAGSEYMETHGLALDNQGHVYTLFATNSLDFPVTVSSTFAKATAATNVGLVKLAPNGSLVASTWFGGSQGEGPDGIYVEDDGDILIGGETSSNDLPLTPSAFDSTFNGVREGFFINMSADFKQLNYATYFGGTSEANVRGLFAGLDGKVYVTGSTNGAGFPTRNAIQPNYGGGSGGCCAIGDAFVARFSSASTIPVGLSRDRGLQLGKPFARQSPNPAGVFPTWRDYRVGADGRRIPHKLD